MFCWLILTTLLLKLATGQQIDTYEFSLDRHVLSRCIEDYLLNFTDDSFYHHEAGVAKVIVDLLAKRFAGKTKRKKSLFKSAIDFFDNLRDRELHVLRNTWIYEPLKLAIKEALIECSVSYHVLIFENEPLELANILDHLLVYWPIPLYNMIRTRIGRLTLRRYVESAQAAFESALDYLGHDRDHFRIVMRDMWMKRAQIYFDGTLTLFPYPRYHYTAVKGIRMYDEIQKIYLARRLSNFTHRNPDIPLSTIREFLVLHKADRPPYVENDIFVDYEHNGMSSAQYFIENHIDQFYRTLIFFLELQSHGIRTKKDDIFDESLPHHILHDGIQKVIFDNFAYYNYLISLRKSLEKTQFKKPDIVLWLSKFINLRVAYSRNITIAFTSSTTPNYDPKLKGKERVLVNDLSVPSDMQGKEKEHQFWNSDKNFGYAVMGTNQYPIFLKKDPLVFSKIYDDYLTPFSGSLDSFGLINCY